MATITRFSDYDTSAWYYNRHWGPPFSKAVFPVIEKLLLSRMPSHSWLLAVCCGTAQLAEMVTERGFRVTGIDSSKEMLHYARQNAPQAEFILADVRQMTLASTYHGAFSTFHAFNHILRIEELVDTFWNIYAALLPGGIFVFDMNMEAGYTAPGQDFAAPGDNEALVRHGSYDLATRMARFDMNFYWRDGQRWQRLDQTLFERCHSEGEVRAALLQAGFVDIAVQDAAKELGRGRLFFVADRR